MLEAIKSLGAGVLCGIVFSLFKLPIPAPAVFNGILGIIGIFIGFYVVKLVLQEVK